MLTTVRLQALKEWAAAIAALGRGDTIVLLRKGGIQEREFCLSERRVLLYPTQSHQDASDLKPAYAPLADRANASGANTPTINYWAEVTHCLTPAFPDCLQALHSFHIWTEAFVRQRLAWKPERPLQVLLLQAYQLPKPLALPERPRGCRSWFAAEFVTNWQSPPTTMPAMAPDRYRAQAKAILHALGGAASEGSA